MYIYIISIFSSRLDPKEWVVLNIIPLKNARKIENSTHWNLKWWNDKKMIKILQNMYVFGGMVQCTDQRERDGSKGDWFGRWESKTLLTVWESTWEGMQKGKGGGWGKVVLWFQDTCCSCKGSWTLLLFPNFHPIYACLLLIL